MMKYDMNRLHFTKWVFLGLPPKTASIYGEIHLDSALIKVCVINIDFNLFFHAR